MSVQEITQKIIADAEEAASRIIQGAELEAKRIAEETENSKKNIKEAAERETKKILEEEKKKAISRANQESRQRINSARRKILNAAYEKALKDLSSLPDEEYDKTLEKILLKLDDKEKITAFIVPETRKDVSIRVLARKGVHQNKVKSSKEFSGGIKAEGENFEYDFTFENLIKNLKESKETEIALKIFFQ